MEYCIMFSQQLSSLWFIWLNPISNGFQMTYSVLSCVMWLGRGQSGLWGSSGKYWHNPGDTGKSFSHPDSSALNVYKCHNRILLFAVARPFSICIAKHSTVTCASFWDSETFGLLLGNLSCFMHLSPFSTQLTNTCSYMGQTCLEDLLCARHWFNAKYTMKAK